MGGGAGWEGRLVGGGIGGFSSGFLQYGSVLFSKKCMEIFVVQYSKAVPQMQLAVRQYTRQEAVL